MNDLAMKTLKVPPKNPPRHHEHLQQSNKIKISMQKSVAFIYTNNEQTKKEFRK
jgi:hypothetical protein